MIPDLQELSPAPTLEELRKVPDTSRFELGDVPRNRQGLARRIFQRNSDLQHTALSESGLEINLFDLNRKSAPSLQILYSDYIPSQDERFVSLQKWEGYVLENDAQTFSARLVDRMAGTEEEAVFSIRQVSEEDRPLIIPGAVFYWSIGYHTDAGGRQKTVSELRFRRLPPLAESEAISLRFESKKNYVWLVGESK